MRPRYCLLALVVAALTGCPVVNPSGRLTIENVVTSYSSPYLLDFSFSLRDKDGHAIDKDPASFTVTAKENGETISATETAFLLARETNKQMKCFLVLDYTNSMVSAGAIDAMEEAAKTFVDSLSEDAQIGVFEFHRDAPPQKVCSLTTYKPQIKAKIDSIWADYVQEFPGASRCWDAVYAAVQELGEPRQDEGRFVVFLSDGRDESSEHSPDDIIASATANNVKIYCVGFGTELRPADLRDITSGTGGRYFPSDSVTELQAQFDEINEDLGSGYTLRWATLKRTATAFTPSFTIAENGLSDSFTAEKYRPADYAGNPFQGQLRIPKYNIVFGTARVYLRAAYMPRYIRQMHIYAHSPYPFTVSAVNAAGGGLCAAWPTPVITTDARGGKWISLTSPNPTDLASSIPYGAFGPILQFNFANLPQDMVVLFDEFLVDNSVYQGTGGQTFTGIRIHNAIPEDAVQFEDFEDALDGATWSTAGSVVQDTLDTTNHCLFLDANTALGANADLELLAQHVMDGAEVNLWFRDLTLDEGLVANARTALYLYNDTGGTIARCEQAAGDNLDVRFGADAPSYASTNIYSMSGWHLLSVCYLRGTTSLIRVFVDGVEMYNATTAADLGAFASMRLRCAGQAGWTEAAGCFDNVAIYPYAE